MRDAGTAVGIRDPDHVGPSIHKVRHYANKQRSLCLYSSLADSDYGVFLYDNLPMDSVAWFMNGFSSQIKIVNTALRYLEKRKEKEIEMALDK
jgi:hypothetical protein